MGNNRIINPNRRRIGSITIEAFDNGETEVNSFIFAGPFGAKQPMPTFDVAFVLSKILASAMEAIKVSAMKGIEANGKNENPAPVA